MFFGSNVEGAVMPISDIVDEIGEVVIAGMIRSVEEREFSNGEKIDNFFCYYGFYRYDSLSYVCEKNKGRGIVSF